MVTAAFSWVIPLFLIVALLLVPIPIIVVCVTKAKRNNSPQQIAPKKFCPVCNAEITPGTAFCGRCGSRLI